MTDPYLCSHRIYQQVGSRWGEFLTATFGSVSEQTTLQQHIIVTEKSTTGKFAIQDGAAIEQFLSQITLRNVFIPDRQGKSDYSLLYHTLLDICVEQKILVNSFSGALLVLWHSTQSTFLTFLSCALCSTLFPGKCVYFTNLQQQIH